MTTWIALIANCMSEELLEQYGEHPRRTGRVRSSNLIIELQLDYSLRVALELISNKIKPCLDGKSCTALVAKAIEIQNIAYDTFFCLADVGPVWHPSLRTFSYFHGIIFGCT